MIEKYEKIWAQYEEKYNKWPRVAERNALAEKVRLARMELSKKKEEAKELRTRAEQVYEAKVQRLEALKQKCLQCYAENQEAIQKRQQLEQKAEEIRARVALKRVAHQQRLEEEKQQRDEELQKQNQEKVESESTSANPGISSTFKLRSINIPVLKLNFDTPITARELSSFSQGSSIFRSSLASTSQGEGYGLKSASQPMLPTSSTASQLIETPTLTSAGENAQPTKAIINSDAKQHISKKVTESGAGNVNLKELVLPQQKMIEKPKSIREVNNVICSSPSSKREAILSTDNIAAKLKETMRPNLNVSEDVNKTLGPTLMTQSSRALEVDVAASTSEVDLFTQEYRISHQDTIEAIGIEEPEPVKVDNVNSIHQDSNKNMDQEKPSELADFTGNSSDLSRSGENDNAPLEDDNGFDFNAEYGDEMYSLQSPPAFEPVMSPVHAGFESSPSKDSEEAQSEIQDPEQPSAFSAFSFFSNKPATTNIFGGQSSSEQSGGENKKQSTSNFSFLF
ncbi:uncharacterized protein LOC117639279 isoform X2 [Thrips palmi]|nr:uncharacterized protein LOC117639279 isoform X2 [Thrips palmi]XP_034230695.1 uncharacterized protein LOC117639279 isoform X2 [Thrips palmi]